MEEYIKQADGYIQEKAQHQLFGSFLMELLPIPEDSMVMDITNQARFQKDRF